MGRLVLMLLAAISSLAGVFALSLVSFLITMLLWNWLMPDLFGLKEITWQQAWGLTFLCSILFKGDK